MTSAKSGDTVQVHYTGTLDDGTTFDSSQGRDPLTFKLGERQVIPGFEDAVTGMTVNDTKKVTLEENDAYGPRHDDAIQIVPREKIPDDVQLFPGAKLQAQTPEGETVALTVLEVNDENATLDANHPLAGHRLTFELELVAILESD